MIIPEMQTFHPNRSEHTQGHHTELTFEVIAGRLVKPLHKTRQQTSLRDDFGGGLGGGWGDRRGVDGGRCTDAVINVLAATIPRTETVWENQPNP